MVLQLYYKTLKMWPDHCKIIITYWTSRKCYNAVSTVCPRNEFIYHHTTESFNSIAAPHRKCTIQFIIRNCAKTMLFFNPIQTLNNFYFCIPGNCPAVFWEQKRHARSWAPLHPHQAPALITGNHIRTEKSRLLTSKHMVYRLRQ